MAHPTEEMKEAIQSSFAARLNAYSAKLDTLQRTHELHFEATMKALDAFRAEMRSEFAALKANHQVEVFRQMMPISERVAVVESRTK